jgi:cytoskeletal protein RodZ
LTTLFGTIESAEAPLIEAAARKKNGWLPLLTVLFLISYGLMTMLIVEQGQTIESQRTLIRELLRDSKELSATKLNAQTQLPAKPQQITPQNPSTQAPAKKAPSPQVGSPFSTHDNAAQQKPFRMPPKTVSDVGDNSRAVVTI